MKVYVQASIKCICSTRKEHKGFDSFVIQFPAVSIFTVHWVACVLPCVCTSSVDQRQNTISLMLDNPAEPNREKPKKEHFIVMCNDGGYISCIEMV